MMNFRINFDILKNKIARLNSLVPSANNSNEYSHFTNSTDYLKENIDKDMKFSRSSSRYYDDYQMRQTMSHLNKAKMYKDFDNIGNNINITDNHTYFYKSNPILLESKTDYCNKNTNRKEKEPDRDKDIYYLNEESYNFFKHRHTVNYRDNNMNPNDMVINNNPYPSFNTHTNYNMNNNNHHCIQQSNSGNNNNHQGNNVNMNLNLNNIYLNTSVNCCELIADSVAQFTITKRNIEQQNIINSNTNLNNKNLSEKSNSNRKSKSSSFNISDIVDDIILIKNTPSKIDNRIDNILTEVKGADAKKDLSNADTNKKVNLFRDLYTHHYKTVYDKSKDENFYKNLNLYINPKYVHTDNCVNLEFITHPIKTEITTKIDKSLSVGEKKEVIKHEKGFRNIIHNGDISGRNQNSNENITDKKKIDESLHKSASLIDLVNQKNVKCGTSDDIIVSALNDKENLSNVKIEENQVNIIKLNEYNHHYVSTRLIDKELEIIPHSKASIKEYEEKEINRITNDVEFKNEREHKSIHDNHIEIPDENKFKNNIEPCVVQNNQDEIQIIPEAEDEDDIEAERILNEIIKNSKLKYEQEKSQSIFQNNIDNTNRSIKEDKTLNIEQDQDINYLKCDEDKIEIKESPKEYKDNHTSLEDSIIFADEDPDPNIAFDIKDQLCSERESLKIIEDIIEDSYLNDISYVKINNNKILNPNEPDNNTINQTNINPVKDLTIEGSNIQHNSNFITNKTKNDHNKINSTKLVKKTPIKKNVAISDKVTTIRYEYKSCVPNLFKKKSDGSLLKIKIRDIEQYFRKLYNNNKPKSILKKKLPEVDEKELALKRLNDLIVEYDNSKESETVNNSKSVSMVDKKRIIDRNKKFIQQIESAHKSGKKFRNLNPKLFHAKKKKESENLCNKFKSNPQKFFSRPPCQVILKSMNIKTNNSAQNLNSDNLANGNHATNKIEKVFRSQENTPDKIQKGKFLMEIINNINIEENIRELELDSKILTHNTFSNLSWISYANSAEKEFLSKSPDNHIRIDPDKDD